MSKNKIWNQSVVKEENKSLVLQTIIKQEQISRADIAKITGLNKGTVSSLVSELLEEHIINEIGPGKSSGGRRPVMLRFSETAGYSIGIDLGVNYVLGVLVDLNGNICCEKQIKINNISFNSVIEFIYEIIDFLISSAPTSHYGVIGIGIGIPGTVNKENQVLLAPNLGWEKVYLKEILEKKYNLPVVVENEANSGAYGEKKFGIGKNYKNIIYVSVGIGIGVGIILNNSIYKGNNGYAGELGHMTIEIDGKKCRCGNEGCWELYASEKALIDSAEVSGIKMQPKEEMSLESLLKLAEESDVQTIKLFEQIGDYLGVGINNVIHIFNPELIIIGNRMTIAQKWIKEPLNKRVINQTQWFQQQDLQIEFSKMGIYSCALGASAIPIENFILGLS